MKIIIPPDIQSIIDQLDQGKEVLPSGLQKINIWYTASVQKLQDDIEITKIKKNLNI